MAIVAIKHDGPMQILHAQTEPFPAKLRHALLALGDPKNDDLDQLGHCDRELGIFIGKSLVKFIDATRTPRDKISAIGSHGQTVRHRPPTQDQPYGFSTQIGDPNSIAETSGLLTIADFRSRDMAAGGQGAPLVPPFHKALFGHIGPNAAVLNVGGISNISLMTEPVSGFDTGPGNALLDSWVNQHLGRRFDQEGDWAASGVADSELLTQLLNDPYFTTPPPKSTGREHFNLAWLNTFERVHALAPVHVQATLCEFTARCTAQAIERWASDTKQVIVCGGGRLNKDLMQRLARATSISVEPSESYGVDGDSIEAALFAWLASRTLNGLTGNEPAVTGARGYRVLGGIYPA